jgi:hypothetical protein
VYGLGVLIEKPYVLPGFFPRRKDSFLAVCFGGKGELGTDYAKSVRNKMFVVTWLTHCDEFLVQPVLLSGMMILVFRQVRESELT